MTRVLVVGGSGLLGQALYRRRRPGHRLALTHHRNPVEGSRPFDAGAATQFPFEGHDIVVLALPLAKTLMEKSGKRAAEDARAMFENLHGARPILLSTDAVFRGTQGLYDERADPDAVTEYGRTQAMLDTVFLDVCPNGLVVRTSFLFGGRSPHFDKRLAAFDDGSATTRDQAWPANIFRSPTEVDFCAEAIWRSAEVGARGILNVCGERMSIWEFFERALSVRLPNLEMPAAVREERTAIAVDTSLNPSQMERTLGLDHGTGWDWYFDTWRGGGGRDG